MVLQGIEQSVTRYGLSFEDPPDLDEVAPKACALAPFYGWECFFAAAIRAGEPVALPVCLPYAHEFLPLFVAVSACGAAGRFDIPAADKSCLRGRAIESHVAEIITGQARFTQRDNRRATQEGHQLQKIFTRAVVGSAFKLKSRVEKVQ